MHLLIILTLFNYSAEVGERRLGIYMAVAAAVRQIRPMRRHTGRSTSFESTVNTGFHGTSCPVLHRSVRIKDGSGIDSCMGSGHIIVAMFDVLMDIYKSVGYGEREAAFEIVEHNLHGLDIDKRAYQLAYFAVVMKGRQYNRRFFRGKEEGQRPQPKVYAFVESRN